MLFALASALGACRSAAPSPKSEIDRPAAPSAEPSGALQLPTDQARGSPGRDAAQGHYDSVLIEGVPHVLQEPDFCGEAVAASYLQALGKPYTQDDVFGLSGMDPARGMGASTLSFVPGAVRAASSCAANQRCMADGGRRKCSGRYFRPQANRSRLP